MGKGILLFIYLLAYLFTHLPRSNILPSWRSRPNQITATRKLQEIAQERCSIRATRYRRYEGDKVGCAGEQAFVVDAFFVFPPYVGAADIGSAGFVAGAALEGQVVGEDVGAYIKSKVALPIVPRGVVGHLN